MSNDNPLLELFRAEAESQTAVLAEGLLVLERGAATPATTESLMRAAHSLKGAARIVGLDAAVRVAHVLEDYFVAVQRDQVKQAPGHIDVLLRGVDLLNQIAQWLERGPGQGLAENEPAIAAYVDEIKALLAAAPVAAPAALAGPREPAPQEIVRRGEPQQAGAAAASLPSKVSNDLENMPLLDLFRTEAETQTAILAEGLLALERGQSSSATIEALMRAAHSLKGAARIVNLDTAVRVAHVLEDYFVAVQREQVKQAPGHIDALLRGVDLLNHIAQRPANGPTAANDSEITAYVEQVKGLLVNGGHQGQTAGPARTRPESRGRSGDQLASLVPAPAPTPSAAPAPPAATAALPTLAEEKREPVAPAADRVVRVTADSLTRLMGLAGESLVEARQFTPLIAALRQLKQGQAVLWDSLRALEERWSAPGNHSKEAAGELLAQVRANVSRCQRLLGGPLEELENFAHRSEDLSGRLHHEVVLSRMRPLADGVRGFPRLVRDLARQLGKTVEFEVRGDGTGVDRDVLDKLEAPLNHLIRNAVDHGVETAERRAAAGKPACGSIRLEAQHRAGMLQITLTDDGHGIDPVSIRTRIVARGLASAAMANQLSEAELFEFLFLPGFTTKQSVSEISGRGVGLDVVQSMVRSLGGSVRVSSVPGRGTTFTLRLPISMSVIRALLVEIADEPYAFPLTRIDRIDVLLPEQIEWLEGRPYTTFDGETIGLVEAGQVLELPADQGDAGAGRPVVVISDRGHRFGVLIYRFLGERDLDVRPLDPRLGKIPNLGGASLLEDGAPVLIFDVEDMVRSIDNLLTGRRFKRTAAELQAASRRAPPRVLIVDDSVTVRELERQLLTGQGYEVDTAVDGMDGWNAVRSGSYQLVVSDVDMPRLDGIELVRRIKQDARLKALPVVIVSYKDREEDRLRGLDAGATCYLTKSSFHDRTFLEAVVDLIGKAR